MPGKLEVITGCMFAGKSEELIRRIRRAKYGKNNIQVFLPREDTRATRTLKTMLPELSIEVVSVASFYDSLADNTTCIAMDEIQFIQEREFVDQVEKCIDNGLYVILAGLDTDFRGKPFGLVPDFMAIADEVVKLSAVCMNCSDASAIRTYRKSSNSTAQIVVGDGDTYEARCRKCFKKGYV